jgi:hypothetical protein
MRLGCEGMRWNEMCKNKRKGKKMCVKDCVKECIAMVGAISWAIWYSVLEERSACFIQPAFTCLID